MVSDKFYFFGLGRSNSNRLPGKNEWKIFNTTNNSSSSTECSSKNSRPITRPQDDWLHITKSDVKCKHTSYTSSSAGWQNNKSSNSIKIPTNNDYYIQHKRDWKHEQMANKENKTKFPKTSGFEINFNSRSDRNDRTSTRQRPTTSSTSSSRHSTQLPHQQHSSYNAFSDPRSTDLVRASQGDVLLEWANNMDM